MASIDKYTIEINQPVYTIELLPRPTYEVNVLSRGPKGDKGDTALTVNVGTTTTLNAGQDATVVNSGTNEDIILDFGIPQGIKGDKGDTGTPGTNGTNGTNGADATINGVNSLTLTSSYPLSGSQVGSTYTINSIGSIIPTATCSTGASTSTKEITIPDADFTNDFMFFARFENANTARPQYGQELGIKANDGIAYPIYDLRGNLITNTLFSNSANEEVLFKWDSANSRYILVTAPFWESRMGLPSSSYIDLTLGASGSTYIAPANGWFAFGRSATAPAGCGLFNQTTGVGCSYVVERSWDMLSYVPAKKGDVVLIRYWQGVSTSIFRFIYAEGSKP